MSRSEITFDYVLPSPIGKLGLMVSVNGIRRIAYAEDEEEIHVPKKSIAAQVHQQLNEYFELSRKQFDLPIDLHGTSFQKKVWRQLDKISYGETLTYGGIAEIIGSGPRAVGNACRNNPLVIIIPCHRVIKKIGLGGYCGSMTGEKIEQKDWLLKHETAAPINHALFG